MIHYVIKGSHRVELGAIRRDIASSFSDEVRGRLTFIGTGSIGHSVKMPGNAIFDMKGRKVGNAVKTLRSLSSFYCTQIQADSTTPVVDGIFGPATCDCVTSKKEQFIENSKRFVTKPHITNSNAKLESYVKKTPISMCSNCTAMYWPDPDEMETKQYGLGDFSAGVVGYLCSEKNFSSGKGSPQSPGHQAISIPQNGRKLYLAPFMNCSLEDCNNLGSQIKTNQPPARMHFCRDTHHSKENAA